MGQIILGDYVFDVISFFVELLVIFSERDMMIRPHCARVMYANDKCLVKQNKINGLQ